jgi:hypothetical protein
MAERKFMAKTQEQNSSGEVSKDLKHKKSKEEKATKEKNGDALVGRVKKVIKKSRRKMGEEKFEKQLQRTIAFLEELRLKLANAPAGKPEKTVKAEKKITGKKTVAKDNSGNSHAKEKVKPKAKSKGKAKAPSPFPTVAQSGKAAAGK